MILFTRIGDIGVYYDTTLCIPEDEPSEYWVELTSRDGYAYMALKNKKEIAELITFLQQCLEQNINA